MFSYKLAKKIFDGFSILRFTDFVTPFQLVEMDKHALKCILCYIIGKTYEEVSKKQLNWKYIVDLCVFGLLEKCATSDIKAPLKSRLRKENNGGIVDFIKNCYFNGLIQDGALSEEDFVNFINNHYSNCENPKAEDTILYFSHKFATKRESQLIVKTTPDYDEANNNIDESLLLAVKNADGNLKTILNGFRNKVSPEFNFFTYFEKLMTQTRWSQTIRLPSTSVLGHSMYVAVLAYLALQEISFAEYVNVDDLIARIKESLEYNINKAEEEKEKTENKGKVYDGTQLKTDQNNLALLENLIETEKENFKKNILNNNTKIIVDTFFASLFHDLPEALTRDVISPVKKSIEQFENILSRYEYEEVESNMTKKINRKWSEEFMILLGKKENNKGNFILDAFYDRSTEKDSEYMFEYTILGKFIKYIDNIAAFMEAYVSVSSGINTSELQKGIKGTQNALIGIRFRHRYGKHTLFIDNFLATIPHYIDYD